MFENIETSFEGIQDFEGWVSSIQSHSFNLHCHKQIHLIYIFCLGEAHLALNDCEAAKADFEKTFQLDPENKVLLPIMFCVSAEY